MNGYTCFLLENFMSVYCVLELYKDYVKISQQREKSETHKAKLHYLFTSHGSERGNLIESFLCSDDRISVNTHTHTTTILE